MNLKDELVYFENYIKNTNPFFYDERGTTFLRRLFDRLAEQKLIISAGQGSAWFRAQTLCDGCLEYSATRMHAPPLERATAGRAAPEGISRLYLANKIENAIFEMRPNPKKRIQVAGFVINKKLKILNFDVLTDEQKAHFKDRAAVDEHISARFSDTSENLTDYLLTQVLSMRSKALGYDGITYSSAQIKKEQEKLPVTLVLFNPKCADLLPGNEKIHIDSFDQECEWITRINEYILTQRCADQINLPSSSSIAICN